MPPVAPRVEVEVEVDVDVVVVGAGPAGASAAIHACRAGLSVVVADRASFPRDKTCGDGLTTAAFRELELLGLDPSTVPDWTDVSDVTVALPGGRLLELELPRGVGRFAAVTPREQLDSALVALVRSNDVEVVESAPVTAVVPHWDRVEVTAGSHRWTARWLIAADGMWSPCRKLLGVDSPGYLGDWHAFRQYVDNVDGPAARELFVAFEADLLPGYFWSFPLGRGRANIGFGIQRGSGIRVREMAALWPELLARPRIHDRLGDIHPLAAHRAWPIPTSIGSTIAGAGRVLFVGDAVAAGDPMTGEGIGQALYTARIAVESIRRARTGAEAVTAYRRTLDHGLTTDHAVSRLLTRALSHRRGADIAGMVAGLTPWTRRNFARWLFEDYPRALLVTPQRWHRGILHPSGAYRTR